MAPRPDPPWAEEAGNFRPCGQKMLVVADGILNYNPADQFGLTVFLSALALSGTALTRPTITTAHRSSDPRADHQSFVFSNERLFDNRDRRLFDQIWLFGFARLADGSISQPQIDTIARFMNRGGGVFATGDHEDLGYAMCGSLPRIRKMRDWRTIPVGSRTRLDTVVDAGADTVFELADQSDDVPQRIFPHYYQSGASWFTHPLLRSDVDIDVLPDHPHESQCLPAGNLTDMYTLGGQSLQEFPLGPDGRTRPAPDVIATSVSGGRHITIRAGESKPPVEPRCFGAISVYDGRAAGVGRIVCDATWHHFVNINLDGTGSGRRGLHDGAGFPTADLQQIFRYYQNTAAWLAPLGSGRCSVLAEFVLERYTYPLVEEWTDLSEGASWTELLQRGALVDDALTATYGRGKTVEVVWQLLEEVGAANDVVALLRPSAAASKNGKKPVLVPADEFRIGVLGGIFDAVAGSLPLSPYDLSKALDGVDLDDLGEKLFAEGVRRALSEAKAHYGEAVAATAEFVSVLGD